jgi:hypothetical protein
VLSSAASLLASKPWHTRDSDVGHPLPAGDWTDKTARSNYDEGSDINGDGSSC